MDLLTQEVDYNLFGSQFSDEKEDVWGKLLPIGDSFVAFNLTKDTYTFGRAETCDYVFNNKRNPCFQAYSKVHFTINRSESSTGCHIFLEDSSSNGVFVNGVKVGKNAKQVLNNNDEISLSLIKNKAFVFIDINANENNKYPKDLTEKYTMTKMLGKGACGEVRLAFQKGSCIKFAVKIISKKAFTLKGTHNVNITSQIEREVEIMKALKHHGIIKIQEVVDTPETVFIILELVEGGELFDRVVKVGSFTEDRAKMYIYQMVQAIDYLHKNGITHRDLKPENILLMDDNEDTLIKVTDFGLSKFVDAVSLMKTFCGTPNYLAPEILLTAGMGNYSQAVDVWSLGVIAYICLVGYPPFSEEVKDMDLQTQITGGHYSFPAQYWNGISDTAKDFISKMLTVDPEERITIHCALTHPWFKDESMKKKIKELIKAYNVDDDDIMMSPPKNPPPLKRLRKDDEGCESPKKKPSL